MAALRWQILAILGEFYVERGLERAFEGARRIDGGGQLGPLLRWCCSRLQTFCLVVAFVLFPAAGWGGALGVGTIGVGAGERIARLAPLADYLAKRLGVNEIDHGRVSVADGVFEMARLLEEGAVDLYFGDPLPAVAVSQLARITLTLQCSQSETHSVVFTRQGGGVVGLEDLVGKIIGFESPVSTFGYLLPKLVLASKGAGLRRLDTTSERVGAGSVGYVFSDDDENTMAWVLYGKVAAGAMRSDRFLKYAAGRSDRVAVVYRSVPLPAQVVALRATLPGTVTSKLVNVMTNMHAEEEGRAILEELTDGAPCEPLTKKTLSPLENVQPFLQAEFGLP